MLSNILTCALTTSVGLGAGLVINKVRAKKRKAQEIQEINRSTKDKASSPSKPPKKQSCKEKKKVDLLQVYGLRPHLNVIDQHIDKDSADELHASVSIHKHLRRILDAVDQVDAPKTKFYNVTGRVVANTAKAKLWIRTLDILLKKRLDKLPDQLFDSIQYILNYMDAEQYNRLLDPS